MTEIIFDVDSFVNKPDGISFQAFVPHLDDFKTITIEQMRKVVDFTYRQYCYWETTWAFSPLANPNLNAKTESEEWNRISGVFRGLLIEHIPTVKDLINKQQHYVLIGYLIQSRVEYNKTRPVERALTSITSHTSILIKKIGLESLGRKLYSNSLYPKGTVGRVT